MTLIEKVKELAEALNNSVYMPYENIIISAHDCHGTTHIEFAHAEPFVIVEHICLLMDRLAQSMNMDRKDIAGYIMDAYINGGDYLDEQADQGDDRGDTGTPAGDC